VIARLRGDLLEADGDHVVVECAGVGYRAAVSAYTAASLPEPVAAVDLRVHTHFSQDKFSLVAFATRQEEDLFHRLITVEKVGPGAALIMLGGGSPHGIARLIAAGDEAGLSTIKGVGKKTAEKVVFKLREPCELLLAGWAAAGLGDGIEIRRARRPAILEEVASALVGLGYRQAAADKAIAELVVADGATVEVLLRDALQAMPR
jgi:Holliday junction DNA helicase RuvA